MPSDKIWYEDVAILPRRWREFFPTADQTPSERVNALVRLILYSSLAVFAYNRQPRTLVFGAAIVAVVSFAFGQQKREAFPTAAKAGTPLVATGTAKCTAPTKDNPFANLLLTDLNKGLPPACEYDSVKDDIRKNFNDGLFTNSTDVYERENSQRQFYTMPVTTGIPDTAAFSKFLYGNMTSCKEDASQCQPR